MARNRGRDEDERDDLNDDERRLIQKIQQYDSYAARETNFGLGVGDWHVDLPSSAIGNAQLAEILEYTRPAKRLMLWLQMNNVTDDGLAALKDASNLTHLILGKSFTDAAFPHLIQLSSLRSLTFEKSKITDTGMAALREMPLLEGLGLEGVKITDKGLVHIEGLTKLTGMDLRGSRTTTASVAVLKKLPNLKQLWWNRKKLTPEGEQDLKSANPQLDLVLFP